MTDPEQSCDFCSYESDTEPPHLNEIAEESWRSHTPARVCDFCYSSLATAHWLSDTDFGPGGRYVDHTLSKDLAVFMNMLREEIRRGR